MGANIDNLQFGLTVAKAYNAVPIPFQSPSIWADNLPFANAGSQLKNPVTVTGSVQGIASPQEQVLGFFVSTGDGNYWGGPTWQATPAADGSWSFQFDTPGPDFISVLMTQPYAQSFYSQNYSGGSNAAIPTANIPDAQASPGDVLITTPMPLGFNRYLLPRWNGPTSSIAPGTSAGGGGQQSIPGSDMYVGTSDPTNSSNAAGVWSDCLTGFNRGLTPGALLLGADSNLNPTGGACGVFLYRYSNDVYLIVAGGASDGTSTVVTPQFAQYKLSAPPGTISANGTLNVALNMAVLPQGVDVSVANISFGGTAAMLNTSCEFSLINDIIKGVIKSLLMFVFGAIIELL